MYNSSYFGDADNDSQPMILPPSETSMLRIAQNLEWIPPYEVHKVGFVRKFEIKFNIHIMLFPYSVWVLDWSGLCWVGTSQL